VTNFATDHHTGTSSIRSQIVFAVRVTCIALSVGHLVKEIFHDPCHAKFVIIAAGHHLPLTHRALTVPRNQILRVLNRLFLYSCLKPEHPPMGEHLCTTGNRSQDLCYDSWRVSHPGYLYPGTTPVMIKLDHNRSCPWI